MKKPLFLLMSFLLLLTACAHIDERQARSGQNLSGTWSFEVTTPRGVTQGSLNLVKAQKNYRGTLTTNQGENILQVNSLTLTGEEMHMTVESPDGIVTFKGKLASNARAFDGVVTYHNGQNYPMAGTKL